MTEPASPGDAAAQLAALRHDLRSPLNVILGFCELLALDGASLRNDQVEGIAEIRRAAQQMNTLIDAAKRG